MINIKNLKRSLERVLMGIVFTGIFGSCSNENTIHRKRLSKYNPIINNNGKNIPFNKLNSGLNEYLHKIYIVEEEDLFFKNVVGESHSNGRFICLIENYSDETFFHESAHIRNYFLDSIKSGFSEEWKKIAGFKYGKKNIQENYIAKSSLLWNITWKDGTKGSKNGIACPEGSENMREDVAYFIECLGYKEVPQNMRENIEEGIKLLDSYLGLYPLYFCNPKDKRYQEKLNLLKKYNFLNEKEYKDMVIKLGSLYDLLEKSN